MFTGDKKVRLEVTPIILVFSALIGLTGYFQKTSTMKKENALTLSPSKHDTKTQKKTVASQNKIQKRLETEDSAENNYSLDAAKTNPEEKVFSTNEIIVDQTIIDTSEYISVLKAIEVVIDTAGIQP
ncbi:MAG TPA: hypothetical protein PKK64_00995 [Saprospiraceae bacterium]|nr:hypothetical protein [Saprospiraceae bacterium]HMX87650.1 hypothetical protein [Saprospiraceae bacterium]HNM53082.1 hypothetical protein [Saprospiraceae bacterium]HNN67031.1 hypothetical protein [Saprospiraceae bacterium]